MIITRNTFFSNTQNKHTVCSDFKMWSEYYTFVILMLQKYQYFEVFNQVMDWITPDNQLIEGIVNTNTRQICKM